MPLQRNVPHWRRRLEAADRPAYLLIADLIAEDLRNGRLSARERLPTLRELADALDLNYTTVARAYAEARKRGLIDSRPGLGSFVRGSSPALPLRGGSGAEMTMNLPPEPQDAGLLARMHESAAALMGGADLYDLMRYQDFGGSAEDKLAAMTWLRRHLPDCSAARVLVCPGIHSVLAALFSQLARPGDLICVEALTYPGVKAIATQLGLRLHALPLDDEGPSAAAFEQACKTLKPRALYCNPTLLNPTTQTVSQRRREVLAETALSYSVPIIEDDAYGMLPRAGPDRPSPIALLAPQLTYYVSGLSKCLGAGLRTAYVCAPGERQAQRLAGALRATTVMASPITNALATRWVQDGTAEAMLQAVRAESIARQALASRHLAGHPVLAQPEGFHLWLPLEARWSVVEFASFLRTRGVGVVASAAFSTDGDPPDAVRICLGGPMDREACDQALRLIADTLAHPQHPHATVM
ncbi:PLP-dependent aminotransferase family protein [Piscinibacter sakaiensis]|uniref:Transcriptional regulator, GntR family domain/aspartate aminotransferase n=1 Tax=Piscinibacter sakaiensis TaxID=1547922 RepID=A0A0K8P269_PISS1|nr:PLP-dependent aminotransferase family protein [Piscinibacter sakaiensis]GAP36265.1 transcriptional regulator, GntR family domain/aspartate aminotransferase [Piscinibacter sakaiensis]